ncbi:hypothetical protein DFH08DRAFT_812629 [Mycena albidolilacea]|uniref:HAT C-terminal dimerisation domain-containing protein n=1 Tax=Mycena albidolilacea TaxID=1033008 RepID=A0AAD6ZTU1_9AGAR|nr:hypothetical protein DFH08DRAFT_812629 [Mycena albidolilacea]
MTSAIVEIRPGLGCNKHLPKRGTLFPSRPEALAFNWLQWGLVNLLLLLLPLGAGVETIVLLGHRLDIFLAYFLVYFSLYTVALLLLFVLDPRISYETLRQDYADDAQLLAELESSKSNLRTHYNTVYAPTEMANSAAQPQTPANGSPQKIDFLARYRNRGRDTHTDELAEYSRIIRFIGASAVAVERIFSGGRDTIGLRRASLKAETIQMLIFVKARLRIARNTVLNLTGAAGGVKESWRRRAEEGGLKKDEGGRRDGAVRR